MTEAPRGEQPASPLKSITLDGTIAHHADGSATWTATSGLERWIKTVRGRLLAVKRLPVQEDREHEATFEAWSDLYEHAPTDLEIALEILNRLSPASRSEARTLYYRAARGRRHD